MAIKVIVELQAKPGGRAELESVMEELGSIRYEVVDNPDLLTEIADWESADARMAHMQESAASGVYKPVMDLLASPIRAMVIRQLP